METCMAEFIRKHIWLSQGYSFITHKHSHHKEQRTSTRWLLKMVLFGGQQHTRGVKSDQPTNWPINQPTFSEENTNPSVFRSHTSRSDRHGKWHKKAPYSIRANVTVSVTLSAWTEDQQLVSSGDSVPNRAPHSLNGTENSMGSLTVSEVESLSSFTPHHGQVHSLLERENGSDASSRVTSPGTTPKHRNDRQVKATLISWVHR